MSASIRSSNTDIPHNVFTGNSELAHLMRNFDWSRTPLGHVEQWPQSLKAVVRLLLTSRYAMWMGWGEDLTFLYNDAYGSMTLGAKHPWALGRPSREVWAEIWPQIGPRIERVLTTGDATWDESLLLFLNRSGYREETYHTFSYSPVTDDAGVIRGHFCVVTEDTERVIGERRVGLLKTLASELASVNTEAAVLAGIERAIVSDTRDLPFSLMYLFDDDASNVRRVLANGFDPTQAAADIFAANAWPIERISRDLKPALIDLIRVRAAWPSGPWDTPCEKAMMIPIARQGQARPTGVFIAGLNPYRQLDDAYQGFLDLFVGQISAGLANARAYEEERRRAEALAELDRAKTMFFSNVSHEFRTPLTLMLGPLEDILAKPDDQLGRNARELLTITQRNGLRLLRLVNTLLDFSRIEAGRVDAVYEPTDLAAVTADLASVFRSAIERAGLRFVVHCPSLPAPVHVDRDMWEKIVLNLLSNAFKFTFEGEIAAELTMAGRDVELKVKDTGTGIAAGELPHLFERFHRVKGVKGRTHEGTGIGLALVHELVKLHGGTIRVASELGRGTTFTVSVPVGTAHLPPDRIRASRNLESAAVTAAPYIEEALRWLPEEFPPDVAGATGSGVPTEGARVLLADDNADMREYLRRLLSRHWIVETARDGEEALHAAKRQRPDLVLTDIMMPKLDGIGLIDALRTDSETQSIPVILLSARAGEESRVEGLKSGADDYLVKPFSARELIARVNAHLQLAGLRQEMITREQAARLQAEHANRAKDEFLALLSHELRTPLNSILGWAVMLKSSASGSMAQALEIIERNARAQAQLIEDLLDVSRIITGKLRLNIGTVDLVTVINTAIDAMRPAAGAKEIRLELNLDPDTAPIAGDSDRLQQVVWNLVSNAIKFTPKRGLVEIRLQQLNSHIEIVVNDSGCGISAEMLPHIFDRFWQADSTSTRQYGGLGLGLALVKHITELHGGTIRAESGGVNKGALFIVNLPLMAQVTPEVPGRQSANSADVLSTVGSSSIKGLRLLVADDDAETVELFTRLLTQQGAEVINAKSAAETLERLRSTLPDVLICDIEMPDEDGYSLIRKVRLLGAKEGGGVPAIAVTAYGSTDDRIRLLAAGFQMHVPKPVDPAELVTVVASVAGRIRT